MPRTIDIILANKPGLSIEDQLAELLNLYEESAATEKAEKEVVDATRAAMQSLMESAGLKDHRIGRRIIRYMPAGQPGETVDAQAFFTLLRAFQATNPDVAQALEACVKPTKAKAAYVKVETAK